MKKLIATLTVAALGCALLVGCAAPLASNTVPKQGANEVVPNPSAPEKDSPEAPDNKTSTAVTGEITEARAKEIALADANLSEADATGLTVKRDSDDGIPVFDVEFRSPTYRFEYEISAQTGDILSSEMKILTPPRSTADTPALSEADARAQILARVPGATDSDLIMKLDREDGLLVYEGELRYQGREYDFVISAADGTLIEWEMDLL